MGRYLYLIVFGPVIEELAKQSGMTYLLEKKPYRVFAAWQFLFVALLSGLGFAVIENLVYIYVYARRAVWRTLNVWPPSAGSSARCCTWCVRGSPRWG